MPKWLTRLFGREVSTVIVVRFTNGQVKRLRRARSAVELSELI